VIDLAITGAGLVSPLGIGLQEFSRAIAAAGSAGSDAFRRESSVLSPAVGEPLVAQAWGFDPTVYLGSKGLRNHDRLTLMMLVAARLALQDAGLKRDGKHVAYAPDRVGVCSATAYGSLESITELIAASRQDPHFVNPNRFPNTVINSAAAYVAIWEDLRAPNITVVDGNCGALDAVLASATHLSNGRGDAFVVGGTEVLSDSLYLAFRKLGVLAEGDARFKPGAVDSQGTRLGEGGAYFVIEPDAAARARGARRYARVRGYGNTFEPPRSEAVLVHASERALERAIEMALRDAKLDASAIDLVCSSVSGFAAFDRAELAAIRSTLGPDVAIAAPKASLGETFGAGGAFGIATALAALGGAGLATLDRPAPSQIEHVLVLSLGFYGNAAALVISR
jgi:3-oxoacyl-(acyl-carrier-protein) synthase